MSYNPDYISHPSLTIRETMDAKGIGPLDLAETGVCDLAGAQALYYGTEHAEMNEEVAEALYQLTNVPSSFWLRRWVQWESGQCM